MLMSAWVLVQYVTRIATTPLEVTHVVVTLDTPSIEMDTHAMV